ncbi:MAG: hypothetical protein FJ240_12190 [Nitrospira sp.]|nr:hypothetical protein [Nitrospira sp.]
MKKILLTTILLVFCLMSLPSFALAVDTVGGSWCVSTNSTTGLLTWGWANDPNVIDLAHVPKKRTLTIYSATFNFYPTGDVTSGCVLFDARDADGGHSIFQTQIYLEPKKTVHLTFPGGLIVKAGGIVSLTLIEGQGTICADAQGHFQ